METPLERARIFLDRRTTAAFLATVGRDGLPDLTPLIAPRLTPEGNLAGGEEDVVGGNTFRNLRANSRASVLLLDPVSDPRSRDGVRLHLEFLGAEEDGPDLQHLDQWLSAIAPGRKVRRRLLFRVLGAAPYRPETNGPTEP
jgi:hypothetical protein